MISTTEHETLQRQISKKEGSPGKYPKIQNDLLQFLFEQKDHKARYEDIAEKVLGTNLTPEVRRQIHAHVSRIRQKLRSYTSQQYHFNIDLRAIPNVGLQLDANYQPPLGLDGTLIYRNRKMQISYLNSDGDCRRTNTIEVMNGTNKLVYELYPEEVEFLIAPWENPSIQPDVSVEEKPEGTSVECRLHKEEKLEVPMEGSIVAFSVISYIFTIDPPIPRSGKIRLTYSLETKGTETSLFDSRSMHNTRWGTSISYPTMHLDLECLAPSGYLLRPFNEAHPGIVYAHNGNIDLKLTEMDKPQIKDNAILWSIDRPLMSNRYVLWFRSEQI